MAGMMLVRLVLANCGGGVSPIPDSADPSSRLAFGTRLQGQEAAIGGGSSSYDNTPATFGARLAINILPCQAPR